MNAVSLCSTNCLGATVRRGRSQKVLGAEVLQPFDVAVEQVADHLITDGEQRAIVDADGNSDKNTGRWGSQ
eukprot:COSAG02_NODE_11753_length_1661_cov_8.460795_1_plen_70_part_10